MDNKYILLFHKVKHPDFGTVRTLLLDGAKPWLAASDVCELLGINNPRKAIAKLRDEDKRVFGTHHEDPEWSPEQKKVTVISEPGFYDLVLRNSSKPKAMEIQAWIMSVLRKLCNQPSKPIADCLDADPKFYNRLLLELEAEKLYNRLEEIKYELGNL